MILRLVALYVLLQVIGGIATWRHARRRPPDEARRVRRKFAIFMMISLSVFVAAYFRYPFVLLATVIVISGLVEVIGPRRQPRAGVVAVAVYTVVAAGFLLFSMRSSVTIVMSIYAVITAFDGFSQVTGQAVGRTPLAPTISPAKTIEGVAGGLAASALAYWALVDFSMTAANVAALLIVIAAALAGDLLASLYKRRLGVKDFSAVIPYHGGVLDRFDSFLLAGCAYYCASLAGMTLPGS